jgi:hypothetical protein
VVKNRILRKSSSAKSRTFWFHVVREVRTSRVIGKGAKFACDDMKPQHGTDTYVIVGDNAGTLFVGRCWVIII